MKKFFGILAILMILSSNCFAMTFSQPEKIGYIADYSEVDGGYEIHGATYNDGIIKARKKNVATTNLYMNGTARFGDGEDAIYFHYKNARNYGGKDISNTFKFLSAYGCEFYRIKTDNKLTLYMVHEWQFDLTGEKYVLLGRRADGVFVKYFDTSEFTKNYFSKPNTRADVPCYTEWNCNGDEISVIYQRMKDRKFVNEGEFRFKWDDKAQWFGIKQVVY